MTFGGIGQMKENFIEGWSAKNEIFQFDPSLRERCRHGDDGSRPIRDRNADLVHLGVDADITCRHRLHERYHRSYLNAGAYNDVEPIPTKPCLERIRGTLGNDSSLLEHSDTMSELISLLK